MWATLVTGLSEVGLTEETARLLRGWYAHKLRSVLNQPAHVSRMPTADLFRLHSIQDPVDKLRDRMRSRLRRLNFRGTAHTPTQLSTITDSRSHGLALLNTPGSQTAESQQAAPTGESVDITTLPYLLQDLQDILNEAQNISAPTEASQQPSHGCTHCDARFVSEYGLHMHVTRMHRDKVDRYIPGDFDRSLRAKDGMPICAACGKDFKQWKGLRDHLLSGACSRPDQLRSLSTTPEAQVQSEALMALASFRAKVQGAPKQSLGGLASSPEAQAQRCTICGFWTPDHTKKVKSHLRQAHVKAWARDGPASLKMCQSFSPQVIKGHPCPFCRKTVYDKREHPEQCVILFQVCVATQSPVALKDSVCVREPARVLLQHTGGFTSTQLDQHGALGLVHFELEGFDCIQKAEDELVRSSQVGLATDNAMHREVSGIPWKKFLDSVPAEDADKGVQESAR